MGALLERWRIDEAEARRRMYRAPTPREREGSVYFQVMGRYSPGNLWHTWVSG